MTLDQQTTDRNPDSYENHINGFNTQNNELFLSAFGDTAIIIDGISKGTVDLYSPTIEWQTSSLFGGLSPGRHVVEVHATGRHDSASTDAYIDIDALEAR